MRAAAAPCFVTFAASATASALRSRSSCSFTPSQLTPSTFAASSIRRLRGAAHRELHSHCHCRRHLLHVLVCSSSSVTSSSSSSARPSSSPSSSFVSRRLLVFFFMSATYALYVFLRSTFTYVSPLMSSSLSLSLVQVGQITSAFPLAYALSRFFTGFLVDRTLPHQALCAGLFLAGLVNLAMGFTHSVPVLAMLWALNGLVQGVGAGASAKMLTAWFPPASRGRYWALWSTSANVGAFLAPIAVARAASVAGFRYGLILPGAAAVCWALLMFVLLRSSPQNAGFGTPEWEMTAAAKVKGTDGKKDNENGTEKQSWASTFVDGVLKNKVIWRLAFAYLFVYLVRSGTKSWLHFWLADARSVAPADAAYRASGMEVGGIVGTFSAGIVSDWVGGRRVPVTIAFLSLVIIATIATFLLPAAAPPVAYFAAFAALGFAINGPQMIIGLIGAEACDRRVVATATGVLGFISYIGAAAAGLPLSVLIRQYGWQAYFTALVAACSAAIAFLAPMWGQKPAGEQEGLTKGGQEGKGKDEADHEEREKSRAEKDKNR